MSIRNSLLFVFSLILSGTAFGAGNTLVIGIYQDVSEMNPIRTTSAANLRTTSQIVERLFKLDSVTGEAVPLLATSWDQIDDLTLRLHLRPGVSFTNGEPMNAEAVAFSIEQLAAEPTMVIALGAVESATVVDDLTVDVKTKTPFPLLVLSLALYGQVVPPVYYTSVGPDGFAAHPIGTGPFVFSSRVPGQSITLTRNDEYWGGPVAIEKLEYRPIPEDSSRIAALMAGEIDLATNIPASQVNRIEQAPGIGIKEVLGFTAKMALIDGLPDSPIADPRLRQAINYAVDKQTLLDVLYDGHGQVSNCQLGTGFFFGFNPTLQPYPFDPDAARALLTEAGYPDGLDIDFKYRVSSGDSELSEAIAAMLEDVGFRVHHIILEGGEFLRQLDTFELRNLATVGMSTAPDMTYSFNIFLSDAPYSYYRNQEFDEVVREANQEMNPDARRALLQKAGKIGCEDPLALFLFTLNDVWGVSDRVHGWEPHPDSLLHFDNVSLD